MKTIYCVPGLGADERIFSQLKINDAKLIHLPWLCTKRNENMQDYAARIFASVNTNEEYYLMGLSFGGMLCSEALHFLQPKGVIYISTAKEPAELPWFIRINRFFPLYQYLSDSGHVKIAYWARKRLGIKPELEVAFFNMLAAVPRPYFAGAISCIVNWKHKIAPAFPFIHIHGDNDQLIPLKKKMRAFVIKGGTHAMVYDKAGPISAKINEFLNDKH